MNEPNYGSNASTVARAPVMIYTLGVLADPVTAAVTVAIAMGLGVGYKVMSFGFPMIFIFGAMLA